MESAVVFVDNILICSKTHQEHIKTLSNIFRIFAERNSILNLEKCLFASNNLTWLRIRLVENG